MKNNQQRWFLGLLVGAFMSLSSVIATAGTLESGLVAYYPFNGNANDESGNGNHGVSSNLSYVSNRFGQSNAAAYFGNNGFVACPGLKPLPNYPVTYSLWCKLDSYQSDLAYPSGGGIMTLIGKERSGVLGEGSLSLFTYMIDSYTNKLAYLQYFPTAADAGLVSSYTPPLGEWNHLVFTGDIDGRTAIYVNGCKIVEQIKTNAYFTNLDFLIGRSSALANVNAKRVSWQGAISDVRIYNRALSASEISELYYTGRILLQDEFADNQLNTNIWQIVPSSYANSSGAETNGHMQLRSRCFLNTVTDFDPVAIPGGLRITGVWTFAASSWPSMMEIVTRGDGVHGSPAQVMQKGVECCLVTDNGVGIYGRGDVTVSNMTIVTNSLSLNWSGNTVYFEVRDSGSNIWFKVVQASNTGRYSIVTADCVSHMPTNRVSFYGREFSDDITYLDDVLIASGDLIPSVLLNVTNGPAAGDNVLVISRIGLGDGFDITNVTVCGIVAAIQSQTSNSVTVIVGPGGIGTGDVVVRSASRGATTLAGVYTYNPQGYITGDVLSWSSVSNLPVARGTLGGAATGGKIYAMGGYNAGWYSTAYYYDTSMPTQGWKSMVSLPKARGITTATSVGGKIYSMGGFNESDSYQSNVYVYDPQQSGLGWQSVSNLPTPLVRMASTVVGDKIYVVGGGATNGAHAGVYEYDSSQPAQGWRQLNSLPDTRENLAATSLNGKLYAFGGYNAGGFSSNAYVCDLSHPELGWASISNMPAARYAQAAVALNGKIYIVGGFNASQTGVNTVYMYDPSRPTQGWLSVSNLPSAKGEAPGVVVNGKIYVISGASAPLTYQSTVYEGSFATGVTPSSASVLGGTTVTIKGVNLGNGGDITNVTLCGVPVSAILNQSSTQVVVTAGASVAASNGAVAVYSVSYGVTVASNVFSYIADQPAAPVALAATSTTISGFTANWSAVGGVDNYRLDVSTSSNFMSYVSGYSNLNVGLVVTFPISGLNAGTPYFYRVRAQKSGTSSTNSATIQTTTESGSVSMTNGPAAGGTVLVITGVGLGDGSDITNVTVCGVVAKIQSQTSNSVTVIVGPGGIGTGDVVVRSASRGSTTLAGAFTYNPQGYITGDILTWGSVSNLPVARGMMGGATAGGRIYVMGGYNFGWYSTAYYYDTAMPDQGWKSMTTLPKARGVSTAASVGGKIYSMGGFNEGDGYQSDVYVYDPQQPGLGWQSVSNLPTPLVRMASTVVGDKIYVIGGGATNGAHAGVYEYDSSQPAQGWRHLNNLPDTRENLAATSLNGKLYAFGGYNPGGFYSNAYVCDPSHPELGWASISNMPAARYAQAAVALNGKIYIVGGFNASQTGVNTVFMYDPSLPTQGWLSVSNLPSAKGESPGFVVNGKIYVISGASAPLTYQSTVYEGSVTPGVTPSSGPVTGGTTVTINGSNLGNGSDITSVTLCGVPVSAILSQSATQVVVTAGASAVAGLGDVAVYSTSYGVTSRSNVFTYIRTHIITASAGHNGSILPSGGVSVMEGQGTNFVVTAAEGRHIVSLLVDGESVGAFGPGSNRYEYTFQNVTTGHTIYATFYNYPPVANSTTVTTALDNATAVELTGSDEDGDPLSFTVTVPPAFGTLTGTGAVRIYTPAPDFIGEDSFKFMADDGRTNSGEAIVTIKVTPAIQKMKIQFSGYTRGEALTNFPLLVLFSPATMTNGFSYHRFASPQGFDLRFTDAAGTSNLNYEIEAWNTNGTSSVWVQVPVLTNGGSILAWWGDRSLAEVPPACATNGATWDAKFKAVWHLGEGSGNAQDSTSARNQGTLIDSVVRTDGKVAGGASFDGGTGEFAVNSTFGLGKVSVTLEAMAYVEPGKNGAFLKVGDNSSGFGFGIGGNFLQDAGQNYRLLFEGVRWIQPAGTVTTGWHHFAMVVSATGVPTAVLDGISVGTFTGSNANAPTGSITHIGGYLNTNQGSYQRHYNGVLDEIRIASVPRSTNWLWACWRNVSSNAVFNPCGAIVPGGKDSHGVPDEWKMHYFGGTGMPDADSLDDWDHDGMINLNEFLAGTNPTNPVSRLEIKSQAPEMDGTNLLLRWSSVAGKFYSVDVGTNLMEGFPIQVLTNVPATPEVNTCTIRVDRAAQKFFRVHVEP